MQIGRASKWFRGLLGLKKHERRPNGNQDQRRMKWCFAKVGKERDREKSEIGEFQRGGSNGGKHAVPVIDEATDVGRRRGGHWVREEWAAVTIQSQFRAYLARKALRALKSLVKLQALVRGHILRRRTADILRGMQALARAQARARTERYLLSESHRSYAKASHLNLNHINMQGPATPEKSEHVIRTSRSTRYEQMAIHKRNGSTSNSWERSFGHGSSVARIASMDDERSCKILEADTSKDHPFTPKLRAPASETHHQSLSASIISIARKTPLISPSSSEAQSLSPLDFAKKPEESYLCTSENSPQCYSAPCGIYSSSFKNGYSECPNYMACTESYKAKVRCISVPKQRALYLRSSSMNRNSPHAISQKGSSLNAKFISNAYPESGRLDGTGILPCT